MPGRVWILHPFFFAIFPVLFLFAQNIEQTPVRQVFLPAAVVVLFTLVFWLLLSAILRNRRKAALIVSLFLLLFFSYGHMSALAQEWSLRRIGLNWGERKILFTVGGLAFMLGTFFSIRTRSDLRNLTKLLNVVAGCLIIMSFYNIVTRGLRIGSYERATKDRQPSDIKAARVPDPLPDIYYIILDRYAGAKTLEEFYGYDNSEFLQYLTDKGFYVATDSHANYRNTGLSLSSSLNMDHLDFLKEFEKTQGPWAMHKAMRDHKLQRFLKSLGYTYVHFGSHFESTDYNEYADININRYVLPEFAGVLFRTTALHPIAERLRIYESGREQYERVLYKLQKLSEIPDMKKPTFSFVHMITPHLPYVFDREGQYVPPAKRTAETMRERYVDQLVYINALMKDVINTIIERSENPPIIVLQADEGPYPGKPYDTGYDWAGNTIRHGMHRFDWRTATDAQLSHKMHILNAYYLPGVDVNSLHPRITPVNSFRLVFNLYFGTKLELLPDKSYVPDESNAGRGMDITAKLKRWDARAR